MAIEDVSVIITTHNEGRDLEVTAALAAYGSVRPKEIIVVDDCSDGDVSVRDRLFEIDGVKVYRTPHQMGVAASRNYGANRSRGDVLVFLDSHMRMPHWWLECIVENVNRYPSAVMCPSCAGFDVNWKSDFQYLGARFDTDKTGIELSWLDRDGSNETRIVPAVLGACYIVPTPIWNSVDGFNPNYHGWGQDEQDISLKAWMLGHEVRGIGQLGVAHRWNRTNSGDFMNTWHPGYNSVVSCHTLLPHDIFEGHMPYLKRRFPDSRVWRLYHQNRRSIERYARSLYSRRCRTDAEIEKLIGPFYPTGDNPK